jgi:hypothetical protein
MFFEVMRWLRCESPSLGPSMMSCLQVKTEVYRRNITMDWATTQLIDIWQQTPLEQPQTSWVLVTGCLNIGSLDCMRFCFCFFSIFVIAIGVHATRGGRGYHEGVSWWWWRWAYITRPLRIIVTWLPLFVIHILAKHPREAVILHSR